MSPSKSSDSGFSESANGDDDSRDDKRSSVSDGDTDTMSVCENKKDSSDVVDDDTKSNAGGGDADSGVTSTASDKTSNIDNGSDPESKTGDADEDSNGTPLTGDQKGNAGEDSDIVSDLGAVSYTHLRAHET